MYSSNRIYLLERGEPYKLAYKTPLYGPCETNALSRGVLIAKGFTIVDGLYAIQICSDPPLVVVL